MFLLDTDHLTIIQWQTQPDYSRLRQRMSRYPANAFYVSIVSFHEQVLGANAYINGARTAQGVVDGYERLGEILADFAAAQVLPFDQLAAAAFDRLRGQK